MKIYSGQIHRSETNSPRQQQQHHLPLSPGIHRFWDQCWFVFLLAVLFVSLSYSCCYMDGFVCVVCRRGPSSPTSPKTRRHRELILSPLAAYHSQMAGRPQGNYSFVKIDVNMDKLMWLSANWSFPPVFHHQSQWVSQRVYFLGSMTIRRNRACSIPSDCHGPKKIYSLTVSS